jgi:4-hydroxy-tetrahydrodipicolinate synthase
LVRLCDLTDAPLGVYECPVPEHRLLSADDTARLAATGRYYFYKETSLTVESCAVKIRAAEGTPLRVFPARLSTTPQLLALGAAGHCGVAANFAPELTAALCDPGRSDPEYRDRVFRALEEVYSVTTSHVYPISAKYVLHRRGLRITTACRSFKADLFGDADRRAIDAFIEHVRFDAPHPGRLAELGIQPGPSTWPD